MPKGAFINSQLSRCSTARVSSTGLCLVGPTEVKAHKSVLLSRDSLKVWNKEHLVDFVVRLYFISLFAMLYSVVKCHSQFLNIAPIAYMHACSDVTNVGQEVSQLGLKLIINKWKEILCIVCKTLIWNIILFRLDSLTLHLVKSWYLWVVFIVTKNKHKISHKILDYPHGDTILLPINQNS